MHHQQHRASHREPSHGLDDLRLGGAVQRGRRFVEQQDGPVGEERPGQREPLPLSGREPRPLLAEHGVRAVRQRVDELQGSRVRERPAHRRLVGVGAGQAYVLADGARVQVRVLRHPGEAGAPFLQVGRGEVRPADPHPSGVGPYEAEQDAQQRRLAGTAGADQGDRLARRDTEGGAGHRVGGAPGVPDGHLLEGDGPLRQPSRTGVRHRGLQDVEDLLGGREPLGRRVVLGTHLPQRQIRLGGENEDDQSDVEVHVAVDQPHADRDRDERDRQGGEQFQDERGEEGDPQGPHGRLPVLAGDPADGLGLRLGPAEHLERRQPRDHVEEVPRQPGEQPPLTVRLGAGDPADEDHEQGDQRQGADDDRRRHPVLGHHPQQHRRRNHHREPQLGQIAREVVVEGVDTTGGQRHQGAGALSAEPSGAERGRPLQQPAAQLRLHRRARPVGGQLGEPGDERPADGHGGEQEQRGTQCSERVAVLEGADHHLGDEHGLGDDQRRPDDAQGDDRQHEEAGDACVAQKTRVDWFHVKHTLGVEEGWSMVCFT